MDIGINRLGNQADIDKLAKGLYLLKNADGTTFNSMVGNLAGTLKEFHPDITANALFRELPAKNKNTLKNACALLASCRMDPDRRHCLDWFRVLGGSEYRKAARTAGFILGLFGRSLPDGCDDLRLDRGERVFEYDMERDGLVHTFLVPAENYAAGLALMERTSSPFAEFAFRTRPSGTWFETTDEDIARMKEGFPELAAAGRIPFIKEYERTMAELRCAIETDRAGRGTPQVMLGSLLPWDGMEGLDDRTDAFAWYGKVSDGRFVYDWPDGRQDDSMAVLELDNPVFHLTIGVAGPAVETCRMIEALDEACGRQGATLISAANVLVGFLDRWTHWSVPGWEFEAKAPEAEVCRETVKAVFRLAPGKAAKTFPVPGQFYPATVTGTGDLGDGSVLLTLKTEVGTTICVKADGNGMGEVRCIGKDSPDTEDLLLAKTVYALYAVDEK